MRENPNPAAFFFDDGDFLNLEAVVYVRFSEVEDDDGDEQDIGIDLVGGIVMYRYSSTDAEKRRLRDALAVYHSKA
jgi:hypothetical protein